ncbi:hypothetical protein HN873_063625, partial [Arachis hypogaea]
GCIVNNARKGKNRRNSLVVKQLMRKEGVKGPARTLTNLRLPKARLHPNQAIRRRISVTRSTMEENSSAKTPTSRHLPGAGQNLSIGISICRRNPSLVRGESCLSAEANLEVAPKKQFQEKLSQEAMVHHW